MRLNTEEVYALKNVRVWYRKDGACRFISHLDINRTITRALQMSEIPLWHTEGFNSRLYVSFALPLSLGFRGTYESVDIRLLEDDYPYNEIISRFNDYSPEGLTAYEVTEPVMKPAAICYAEFEIIITSEEHTNDEIFDYANTLLNSEKILVEKTTKKGTVKQVNLKENIVRYTLKCTQNGVELSIVLPAGSVKNVNPSLLTDVIEKNCGFEIFTDITRKELYTENWQLFR